MTDLHFQDYTQENQLDVDKKWEPGIYCFDLFPTDCCFVQIQKFKP